MKLLVVLISIVWPLMFAATETFAQIEQVCADPLDAFVDEKIEVQRGGLYMTSEGTLRVLLVFVQFRGDSYEPNSPVWKPDSLPTFFHTFMDSVVDQQSTQGNLSHYYREMSFDRFRLIADPYFVITEHTERYYEDTLQLAPRYKYGYVNREVLRTLDAVVDYRDYDNWVFGTYNHYEGQDNKVDLIFMYYRNISFPPRTTGVASLGEIEPDTVLDGVTIKFGFPSSGVTNGGGATGQSLASCKHEIGHLLFGAGHPSYSNAGNRGIWGIMPWSPIAS